MVDRKPDLPELCPCPAAEGHRKGSDPVLSPSFDHSPPRVLPLHGPSPSEMPSRNTSPSLRSSLFHARPRPCPSPTETSRKHISVPDVISVSCTSSP